MRKTISVIVLVLSIALLTSITSCDNDPTVPSLSTFQVSSVTSTQAQCIVEIHGDGGSEILQAGICWGTTNDPVVDGGFVYIPTSFGGSFTGFMTGLTPNTSYYVRGYALNAEGYAYGNVIMFTTQP